MAKLWLVQHVVVEIRLPYPTSCIDQPLVFQHYHHGQPKTQRSAQFEMNCGIHNSSIERLETVLSEVVVAEESTWSASALIQLYPHQRHCYRPKATSALR